MKRPAEHARDDEHRSEFYRPLAQAGAVRRADGAGGIGVIPLMFVVRTPVGRDDVARSVRGLLAALDPALPIAQVGTLPGAIDDTAAQQRLSCSGSSWRLPSPRCPSPPSVSTASRPIVVNRRQHEMAVRVALGARPSSIEALVVGQALPIIGIGLVLGLATSAALSRYVSEYLFRVSRPDGWAYVAVSAILSLVVAAASCVPARRAGGPIR